MTIQSVTYTWNVTSRFLICIQYCTSAILAHPGSLHIWTVSTALISTQHIQPNKHPHPTEKKDSSLPRPHKMSTNRMETILDTIQDISATSFGSFLIIHLSAPISALIWAGEPTASSVQLLGRVWYQDSSLCETLIVWGSLSVHVMVGMAKRIIRVRRIRRVRGELESAARESEQDAEGSISSHQNRIKPPLDLRKRLRAYIPRTWHAITAYVALPFVIEHILSHRLRPPTPVSYLFVSRHLQSHPFLSIIKYGALVSLASFHAIVGVDRLWNKYRPGHTSKSRSISDSERSWSVRLGWFGIVGAVGLGMRQISREPVPSWLARRYDLILG